MKFAIIEHDQQSCWIVEAPDKHNAIASAVKNGFCGDMSEFYYGYEDGQISILSIEKEIPQSLQGKAN